MKMQHLLIEGYCDEIKGDKYPCKNTLNMGIHCLECSQFSFTKCPNEIAVSNEEGVVENEYDYIGFGGDMESEQLQSREYNLSVWKKICREKINEVYDEYMKRTKNIMTMGS